jgi:hypothetical protein
MEPPAKAICMPNWAQVAPTAITAPMIARGLAEALEVLIVVVAPPISGMTCVAVATAVTPCESWYSV